MNSPGRADDAICKADPDGKEEGIDHQDQDTDHQWRDQQITQHAFSLPQVQTNFARRGCLAENILRHQSINRDYVEAGTD